jgi:phospholipase C
LLLQPETWLADDDPGPRVPRVIVSPYARGGNVFTEYTDHTSDIQFVEQWAAAKGYKGVRSKEMTQWRRDHMSDMVNALDFENVRAMISHRQGNEYMGFGLDTKY